MAERPTILVVDDNPATLYATARVLRAADFTVLEAASGEQALGLATPDVALVVLDVNLPDMDGFAVCRRLHSLPATQRTPVIYLSASFVSDVDKVLGLEAGAEGYLTHPVEPPVLVATVSAFLRTRTAEAAMRQSEAKFRAIFERTMSGMALISGDWIYLEVNPALCEMLGRPRDEIVGLHTSAFLPSGKEPRTLEIGRQIAAHGKWHGLFPLLRVDGRQVELEWSLSRLSEAGVQMAVISDVTERRRVEQERERLLASERAARTEAERANRTKDEFLANLSHELRTPLNAIIGWVEMLKSGALKPEEVPSAVEVIERNAKLQAELIADMLDMARITSGKVRLECQLLDLATVVRAAIAAATPAAEAKNLSLDCELRQDHGWIEGDSGRLQQIVWNLLNNAVKFTPPGGEVRVILRAADGRVEIEVADSGCGVEPEFLPHLFERFQQQDVSSRKSHGGLGLGLAIVKHLAELHQGSVTAYSDGPGQGARFVVSLPRANEASEFGNAAQAGRLGGGAERALRPPDGSLAGLRVLLVDDDADSRAFLRRLLLEHKVEVAEAAGVGAALELLDPFQPQLLVSDIGMPLQDGYDLIRHVRARKWDAHRLPAIAVTAFVRPEDRQQALSSDYQAHLGKPISPQAFMDAVQLLHRPRRAAGGGVGR